jgi:death-on-curing protein
VKKPRWISLPALLFLHQESLAEFGGPSGIRDRGLLESAMARPRNQFEYEKACDLADLAAAYGFGISSNHPFLDGNKRTAFAAVNLFLELNGQELHAEQGDAVRVFLGLAAGKLAQKGLAQWIRENSKKIG